MWPPVQLWCQTTAVVNRENSQLAADVVTLL